MQLCNKLFFIVNINSQIIKDGYLKCYWIKIHLKNIFTKHLGSGKYKCEAIQSVMCTTMWYERWTYLVWKEKIHWCSFHLLLLLYKATPEPDAANRGKNLRYVSRVSCNPGFSVCFYLCTACSTRLFVCLKPPLWIICCWAGLHAPVAYLWVFQRSDCWQLEQNCTDSLWMF